MQGIVDFILTGLNAFKLLEVLLVRLSDGLGLFVSGLQFLDASEELSDVELEDKVGLAGLDERVSVFLRALDLLELAVGIEPRQFPVAVTLLGPVSLGAVVMLSVFLTDAQLGLLGPAFTDLGFDAKDGAQMAREVRDNALVVELLNRRDGHPRIEFSVLRIEAGLPELFVLADAGIEVSLPASVVVLVEVQVIALMEVVPGHLTEDGLEVALKPVVESLAGLDALEVGLTEGVDFDGVFDDVDVSLDCRGSRIGCLCVWLGKLWPRRACS